MWESVLSGLALAAVYASASWLTLQWSWKRSPDFLVQAFLGGMAARLLAVGLALALIFKFTAVQKAPFAAAFAAAFLAFQIAEIALVIRRRESERTRPGTAPEPDPQGGNRGI